MKATQLLILITTTLLGAFACNELPLDDSLDETEVTITDQDFFFEKGALMGIHFGLQKENVSLAASRNFLRYQFFPAWKDLCPGSKVYYLRPDRGPRIGSEGFFWVFQDKDSRNRYFPEKDFPTEEFESLRKSVDWLYSDTTFFKYFQFGWNTSGFSSDYEIVGVSDSIDKEWLVDDALIVFQHYPLKEGIDTLAFERFIDEEWAPVKSEATSGAISAFVKVTRGYRENEYAQLWIFESMQARNKVFPYEGTPEQAKSASSDDPIQNKLAEFIDFSESKDGHYEIIY